MKENEILTDEELNGIIGGNVKHYRLLYNLEKEKLTQEMLAEKAGVGVSVIGNLESKKINQGISTYTMYKICQVLGIEESSLFKRR